ncbi:MAG: hypothetical protein LBS72_00870 [Oscillospiraceae bacterium]|jgi:hypothetical protein|nr:hypothetical protein [Oscillospiraceae bacterium]
MKTKTSLLLSVIFIVLSALAMAEDQLFPALYLEEHFIWGNNSMFSEPLAKDAFAQGSDAYLYDSEDTSWAAKLLLAQNEPITVYYFKDIGILPDNMYKVTVTSSGHEGVMFGRNISLQPMQIFNPTPEALPPATIKPTKAPLLKTIESLPFNQFEPVQNIAAARFDQYIQPLFTQPDFPDGESLPVFSGPGEHYLRPANGRAAVGTSDWIRVYGLSGDWALIEYSITDDVKWRCGYIRKGYLPAGASVLSLPEANIKASLINSCSITDDPNQSQEALTTLNRGGVVLYLFRYGDWAYVEALSDVGLLRGYVPLSSLIFM